MTLTRREKILIITGLIVVSLAAYAMYFLIPFFNNTNDANTRTITAQGELNTLNGKLAMSKLVKDEIASLNSQLKSQGTAIPSGIDHARILLYLKELTDGKATGVNIQVSGDTAIENRFLLQPVTVDFQTTYPMLTKILENLKKNGLYNQVTFLKVDYVPATEMGIAPAATTEPADSAYPVQTAADKNILAVHLEMSFYALQPSDSEQPQPVLTPASTDRNTSLFPLK